MKPTRENVRLLLHLIPAPVVTVMKNKAEKRVTKFDYRKELKHY